MKGIEGIKGKLGFGFLRLPVDAHNEVDERQVMKMVDTFMERGFNYFDTAYTYMEKRAEGVLKRCLVERYPRASFLVADKMTRLIAGDKWEKTFAQQLDNCGVDYFDFYMHHNVGKERYAQLKREQGFEFLKELKEKGKVRYIGFSFHDTADVLEQILCEQKDIDFVQLQINYLDWESSAIQSKLCYEVAGKYHKPVIVMEPVKGGRLAKVPENLKGKLGNKSPASYAVRFAASLENVQVVLSGMSTIEQVLDNTQYMANFVPLNQYERELIAEINLALADEKAISCTQCKYCTEVCARNIPIPEIFEIYNNHLVNDSGTDRMLYERACAGKAIAGNCIVCGNCEKVCPQHLEIRKYMEKVSEKFDRYRYGKCSVGLVEPGMRELLLNRLREQNMKQIGLYGYGENGKKISGWIKESDIQLEFITDKTFGGDVSGLFKKVEDIGQEQHVDAILVCCLQIIEVRRMLKERTKAKVIWLPDLLENREKEG